MKELVKINKGYVYNAVKPETGAVRKSSRKRRGENEPREWSAWSRMLEWQREEAFVNLKVSSRHKIQFDLTS